MDAQTRLLYWLLSATKGGPTRIKLLQALYKKPMNTRQLALDQKFDYKTIQGHIKILLENNILDKQGKGYGCIYFISPQWESNIYLQKELGGKENDKKRK